MKTQLLILLSFFFLLHHSYSQPDKQWLIWNNKGKNGVTTAGNMNNYISPELGTTNKINLQGVKLPVGNTTPQHRNDIFVIYGNGQHFNSRYSNPGTPGFFYNEQDFVAGVKDHNFLVNPGLAVGYLYLTHTYEGDDLPELVKVKSGFASTARDTYNLETTNSNLLSANHDVALSKDIVVIINLDSLRLQPNVIPGKPSTLRFDGVEAISDSRFVTDNILTLQPVFSGSNGLSSVFPSTTFTAGETTVTLDPNHEKYAYINFRPTQRAFDRYGPDGNGDPRYKAVFTLINNGNPVRQLKESIRFSSDPNFLQVKSICKSLEERYIVIYHLEFENVSETVASNLKAQITFPDTFDLGCINATKWYAGGTECKGVVKTSGRTVTFEFVDNLPISRCKDLNDSICKGYVEFYVRAKPEIDLVNYNNNLQLDDVKVYFDNKPFPINRFEDLMVYKTEWRRPIDIGYCGYCDRIRCVRCYFGVFAALAVAIAFFMWRRRRRRNG